MTPVVAGRRNAREFAGLGSLHHAATSMEIEMTRYWLGTLAAAGLTLGLGVASALAMPGATKEFNTPESLVQKTWGCHRSCEWGPDRGWHRHAGPACVPVACYPRAEYPDRCWVDWRGIRHCRW